MADYLFNEHNDINAFQEARTLLNEHRSNFSCKETNKIRKKLYKKKAVDNFLKEKEQNGSLTNSEKKVLKKIDKYLKNFKNDLDKLQKYQYNTTQGLDYLFNEPNEDDYYKPIEVKTAFDGSYVLYESNGDKDSRLSIDEYFNIIGPYLKDRIDNHKSKGEWKIQLSMQIIFVSFTDANETHAMHAKSDNITIMRGVETEDIINELFNTFRKRYQEGLETKMRGSSFTFDRIDLLKYHLHKISLNRGNSYIESPERLKNKGVTINPKNTKDNNCFQYAITAALNGQNIDNHPERISNLKPFINNYNWKNIVFPADSKDWRKSECNNKKIALNVLYEPYNAKQEDNDDEDENGYNGTKKIRPAYIPRHNNKRDTQVNLLKINDETTNWHYPAVKRMSGLLRGITSRHNGDFYCLNCFHSYTTENKYRKHEKICNDHDFYFLKMPDDDNKTSKYVPGKKSIKVPFIICADLECLLQKIEPCQNNPEKSYAEKKVMHKPSGYSLITCCSFDKSENERKYYRGKDCMKMFCNDLKEQVNKIISYEMKAMIPLTNEEKNHMKIKKFVIYVLNFVLIKIIKKNLN